MFDFIRYDFGYSWYITYGHLVPLALAASLVALAIWRGWRRWILIVGVALGLWAMAGLVVSSALNAPMELPTSRFLAAGTGRVLDAGAGSGRAAIGVLLARPGAIVTGLDIYSGYWGIDDNTPERFMLNARVAGVADRAQARTGDMRDMPFDDGEFDAVISAYAIDHLRQDGIVKALAEVGRVLKPNGEFLLSIVNPDWVIMVTSPPIAHHPRPDPARWRARLEQAGFVIEEEGRKPATLYFYARKAGRASERR